VPRFLQWWSGELRPLIPASVLRWFEVPGEKLLITSAQSEWLMWRAGKDGVQLLDRLAIDADPEQSRDRLQACLDRFQEALTAVIYCLPAHLMLSKRLRMPLAAEANLRQAVGFELDRQTPFKPEEVYFDVKVVQRDAPFIDVDLYLVLRSEVDAMLQQLARLGLNLQGVDIDRAAASDAAEQTPPQPLQINLLPPAQRGRRSNRRVRFNWMLGAAAVVLLVVLMAESLYLRSDNLQQLQQQRDSLRSEAMQVSKLEQQLDEAIEAANFLAEQQANTPQMLDVIAEVTALLPQHTWIQRLQMNGTELELLGLSDRSQQMIELLDRSPMLDNSSFKGTIATDRRLNKERFTATAKINPAASFAGKSAAISAGKGAAGKAKQQKKPGQPNKSRPANADKAKQKDSKNAAETEAAAAQSADSAAVTVTISAEAYHATAA